MNAFSPISVTLSGIVTFPASPEYEKASMPIDVRESPSVTVTEPTPENAPSGISVRPLRSSSPERELHL